jgi:uncharacterized protein YkwD
MPRKLILTLGGALGGLIAALVFALAMPAASTSADPQLDPEEQAFVTLINNYRAQNSLGALSIDWEMQASSDWMSADMGQKAYFSHTDSGGRSPWTRMCSFGYCYNTWMGENIAAGFSTAQSVFTAWQNSLGSNYTAMGISRVYTAGSPYGWYWTNDFGGVNSNSSPPSDNTATPTASPSRTPSPSPSRTASPTRSPSPTPVHTVTPTPVRTAAPTPVRTATPTPTPTPTPIRHLTATPTPTAPAKPQGITPRATRTPVIH